MAKDISPPIAQALMADARTGLRQQRVALARTLEQLRELHADVIAERSNQETRSAELAAQITLLEKEPPTADQPRSVEASLAVVPLADSLASVQQGQSWLAERDMAVQGDIRKVRSALQHLDDGAHALSEDTIAVSQRADGAARQSGIRVLQAQEAERQRLAREIHDGPAQALANVIFTLEYCELLWQKDPQHAKRELGRLRKEMRQALTDMRYYISDLRPSALRDLGLEVALLRHFDEYQTRFHIGVIAELKDIGRLPAAQELAVFRIVQEALQNVRKHSGASEVRVEFAREGGNLAVRVRDNGAGFDLAAEQGAPGRRFGLAGMNERAASIGADLTVTSGDEGTQLQLIVPPGEEWPDEEQQNRAAGV